MNTKKHDADLGPVRKILKFRLCLWLIRASLVRGDSHLFCSMMGGLRGARPPSIPTTSFRKGGGSALSIGAKRERDTVARAARSVCGANPVPESGDFWSNRTNFTPTKSGSLEKSFRVRVRVRN